jgi:hypothetical protein
MFEDKAYKHRNKPHRMNDAEIMVILILFHSGGFKCFKHYSKEYVCKHLTHLFLHRVSYNRFVELENYLDSSEVCNIWNNLSSFGAMIISVRRFLLLPSIVSLSSTGIYSPRPLG